jgi:hypothetical protein
MLWVVLDCNYTQKQNNLRTLNPECDKSLTAVGLVKISDRFQVSPQNDGHYYSVRPEMCTVSGNTNEVPSNTAAQTLNSIYSLFVAAQAGNATLPMQ